MCEGCQSADSRSWPRAKPSRKTGSHFCGTCAKLIADQFPSSQLELFRVSAQRVQFGQQADDVRFIRGLNYGERLRFRGFENRDRLLHTHGGKQGGVGIVQNVAN